MTVIKTVFNTFPNSNKSTGFPLTDLILNYLLKQKLSRSLRKVITTKVVFPDEIAVFKLVYLALRYLEGMK